MRSGANGTGARQPAQAGPTSAHLKLRAKRPSGSVLLDVEWSAPRAAERIVAQEIVRTIDLHHNFGSLRFPSVLVADSRTVVSDLAQSLAVGRAGSPRARMPEADLKLFVPPGTRLGGRAGRRMSSD